eukprot:Gregarina_sp_Poly_1__9242@NODE_570_length_7488_cov_15_500606_g447_i0_p1_GENE_NODE_570_length_7488_cov_15_500606_g447_i0NODE_570_length_7488_cov_15_500606_g447_i0_p1_ORF_typecomplete_len838_score99_86_NODE_570_length_7488_cov_15_500606_g447_i035016014
MHRQVNSYFFPSNEKLSNFCLLEIAVNPLLQILPGSSSLNIVPDFNQSAGAGSSVNAHESSNTAWKFQILKETLISQRKCAHVWSHVAERPVENLPLLVDIENVEDYFLCQFETWRGFSLDHNTSKRHNHRQSKKDVLKVIRSLSPWTSPPIDESRLSQETSLVLAFLLDAFSYRIHEFRGLGEIFDSDEYFTSWLERIIAKPARATSTIFCVRVAYRYFILECLRNSPSLLSTLHTHYNWKSSDPVKEMWKAFSGQCSSSPPDPNSIASGSDSNTHIPNDAEQEMSFSSSTPWTSSDLNISKAVCSVPISASIDRSEEKLEFAKFLEIVKNRDECGVVWSHITESPVDNPPFCGDIKRGCSSVKAASVEYFQRGFDRWRNSKFNLRNHGSMRNNHKRKKSEVLKLVGQLFPLTESGIRSSQSSLVLAILMDPPGRLIQREFGKLLKCFESHTKFITWLRGIVQNATGSKVRQQFCLRVAYSYYVLESLRLSSRLSSRLHSIYKWESEDPVKEIWNAYLGNLSSPDPHLTPSLSHNSNVSNGAKQPMSLTQLKFLFGLMAQVSSDERSEIPLETWEKIFALQPQPWETGNSEHPMGNLNFLWQKFYQHLRNAGHPVIGLKEMWQSFCGFLGVSRYCSSNAASILHQTNFPLPVSKAYVKFLWDSALPMLAETRDRWESPEWLLVLSVFSVYLQEENDDWMPLKILELEILRNSTILERIFFRYFLLAYVWNHGICDEIDGSWINALRRKLSLPDTVEETEKRGLAKGIQLEEIYRKIHEVLIEWGADYNKERLWDGLWDLVSSEINAVLLKSTESLEGNIPMQEEPLDLTTQTAFGH